MKSAHVWILAIVAFGCDDQPPAGGDPLPPDVLRIEVDGKSETHAIPYDFGDPWDTGDVALGRASRDDLIFAFRRADDEAGHDARIVNVDIRGPEDWIVRTQRGSRYLTSLATPHGTRFSADMAQESSVDYGLESGEVHLHLSATGGFVHEKEGESEVEVWDPEITLELDLRMNTAVLEPGYLHEESISDPRFANGIFHYEVGCDTCDLESLYNGGAIHLDDQGRGSDRLLTYYRPDEDVLWGAYADVDGDGRPGPGDYSCLGTEDTRTSCEIIE